MRTLLLSSSTLGIATLFFALGCSTNSQATGPTPCNGQECKVGEACVVTTSSGGACMAPGDGGLCPNGQPPTGPCCDNSSTTYECKALPSACGGALACPCAESLCQCGGCAIADAGVLTCACLYP